MKRILLIHSAIVFFMVITTGLFAQKSVPQLTEKTDLQSADLFHIVRSSVDYKIQYISMLNMLNTDLDLTGNYFINGGNSFSGAATLGTNDGFGLNLETNGTTRLSINSGGTSILLGNSATNYSKWSVASNISAFELKGISGSEHHIVSNNAKSIIFEDTTGVDVGNIEMAAFSSYLKYQAQRHVFTDLSETENDVFEVKTDVFQVLNGSNTNLYTNTSQVGIGTNSPNASAILDITSTTKGFLPPRMTTAQRNAIGSPTAGLIVYNTSTSKHQGYDGSNWNDFAYTPILHNSISDTATGGDTLETVLKQYTLPGGTLSTDGSQLIIRTAFTTAGNANSKTLKIKFGATTILTQTNSYPGSTIIFEVIINRITGTTQASMYYYITPSGSTGSAFTTSSETLSGDVVIQVLGENGVASAGDIVCKQFSVEHLKK